MFMKTIATWISENPYIAAAGLIATFLGLIIAIITPIIQRKRKQLHYTISTTLLVEEKISNIKNLEIFFSGEKIQKLSVTNIKIWNGGNALIDCNDIYAGHELTLRADDSNCLILGVDIAKQSADTIQCQIDNSSENIKLLFQTFEKKDYILLNIYHTGDDNTNFKLLGKIKDGKILDKTIDVDETLSVLMKLTSASSIGLSHKTLSIFTVPMITTTILKMLYFNRKRK